MVGAVAEIGRLAGVATPYVDTMYAILRRLAQKTGCYFDNPAFSLDYD
jgi:ketopantoate reductase